MRDSVNGAGFSKENEEYKAMFLDGALLDIALRRNSAPSRGHRPARSRGARTRPGKEARLETGLEIMVPLFVAKGKAIRVDTALQKCLQVQTM